MYGLAGAPTAATMDALNDATLLEFGFGHAANAVGAKVGVACLDTAQAAQILIARLLPFGYQIAVGDLLLQAVLVQLTADGLAAIEQVVNVARLLVMDLKDGPQRLCDALAFMWLSLSCK